MTAQDDARNAIAAKLGRDYWPCAELNATHALAAVMPDGRTIGEWLDENERLRAVVEAYLAEEHEAGNYHAPTTLATASMAAASAKWRWPCSTQRLRVALAALNPEGA